MAWNKDNEIPDQAVMKLVLTSFLGAQVKDVENENGDMERCVCIPIDRNGLRVGQTGKVSCYCFVNKTQNANRYGWSHWAKLKGSPAFVNKLKSLGFSLPYIGNLKPSNYVFYNENYKKTVAANKVKLSDYEDD